MEVYNMVLGTIGKKNRSIQRRDEAKMRNAVWCIKKS